MTDLVTVSDGNHLKISDAFVEQGIPYYRGQDIHAFFIERASPIYITQSAYEQSFMIRSYLHKDDILLSIIGTIGGVSLVTTSKPQTCNCKLAILRPKKERNAYLVTFLLSKFGQSQIERFTRGALQKGLILEDMDQILVPIVSIDFQDVVTNVVNKSKSFLDYSDSQYQQAEDLLLEELGLRDWEPTEEAVAVKGFAESFLASGRLDAEYYRPKYDRFYQLLKTACINQHWELKRLKQLSSIFKYGTSSPFTYMDNGIPFLRIADLAKYRFSEENLKFISSEAAISQTAKVRTDDILISRSGTLGLAVVIPEALDDAVYGSYFILIRPNQKNVSSTYLTLLINSLAGKIQTEQANTGGIQTNLTIPVLESLLIPCPPLSSPGKKKGAK